MENTTSPLIPDQSTEPKSLDKKGKKKEMTFPFLVKKGSVSVKIYSTPSHGYESFTVAYWQDGVRKRPTFPTFERAKAEADLVVGRLASKDLDVLSLRSADRAAYLRATELLAEVQTPLEVAAAQFAAAKKALKEVPLMTAVEFYLQRHPTTFKPRLIKEVVEEMLAAKKSDGLNEFYLRHLGYDLEKFSKAFNCSIGAVSGTDIDSWLRKLEVSPRTRKNLRTAIQTLFNYAKARRYLPKDHDEIESVALAKDKGGEIEIFSPAELADLLNCARSHEVPFLTLAAFAGIRHAEIQRLCWEDVKFDSGVIEIRASKAKTASRRIIPLLDNLRAWLLPYRKQYGPICTYLNMAHELSDLVKLVNKRLQEQKHDRVLKWKRNGLRHSFISYRVADTQNVNQVALEAGNSPQVIFKHYRELVTVKDAARWFSIKPGEDGKIIFLEAEKAAANPDAEKPVSVGKAEAQALPAAG